MFATVTISRKCFDVSKQVGVVSLCLVQIAVVQTDRPATRDAEPRGRWTAKLIPNVRRWTERMHGKVEYYITEMLSGHGHFRSYPNKMGEAEALSVRTARYRLRRGAHLLETISKARKVDLNRLD